MEKAKESGKRKPEKQKLYAKTDRLIPLTTN
jgi:hypothetical protein